MEVDEIGPSLRYATAKVNRTQRGSSSGGGFGASGSDSGGGSGSGSPADDPWGSAPASSGGFSDEPPF
jgi:single-strand DNA-binding protein